MSLIKLSRKNLFHNLDLICDKTGDKNKIAVVLKDNAYGHGLEQIASLARDYGITNAIVKTQDEAIAIASFFDTILILGKVDFTTYSHSFHITVNALEDIDKIKAGTSVELKVDTGMHRNGIDANDLEIAILKLYERKINIKGIFTHHRSADKLSGEFFWQNAHFSQLKLRAKNVCEQLSLPIPRFHSMNSAALFRCETFDEDLARVGIALYGYIDNDSGLFTPDLKPVMSLWGEKISTRTIQKNQKVGYGGGFVADQEMTISTYDIGYGDGFLRLSEFDLYTAPNGAKLLGRVSMDSVSFDCTDEQLCIFDNVQTLAKIHKTITYEITTTLSSTITREVFND